VSWIVKECFIRCQLLFIAPGRSSHAPESPCTVQQAHSHHCKRNLSKPSASERHRFGPRANLFQRLLEFVHELSTIMRMKALGCCNCKRKTSRNIRYEHQDDSSCCLDAAPKVVPKLVDTLCARLNCLFVIGGCLCCNDFPTNLCVRICTSFSCTRLSRWLLEDHFEVIVWTASGMRQTLRPSLLM